MLPGFVLMLVLSWYYTAIGMVSPIFTAVLCGCQPAVAALIARAVHRIGQHALTNRWLWIIAVAAGAANMLGAHFLVTLIFAGLSYIIAKRQKTLFWKTLVNNKALQTFLDGVTAGVVGLIATTAIGLLRTAITGLPAFGIFVAAGFILYWWKAKVAVAIVMVCAGALGLLLFQ